MKKFFILIILFLEFAFVSFAQIQLTVSYNENDVTNQTIALKRGETMYFPIANNSSSDMNVTIEVTDFSISDDESSFTSCWQNCYVITAPVSLGTLSVSSGGTSGNTFDAFFNANNNASTANITYHIYKEGNPSDFISLTLDSEVSSGISDIQENQTEIYPNPAKDYFTVTIPKNNTNSMLVLSNILGKNVKTIILNYPETGISVKELTPGIYFASIISNGKIIDTKKLIIKQ